VLDDLGHTPILILRGVGDFYESSCEVGIESTVCRLEVGCSENGDSDTAVTLRVLRRGGVSSQELREALGKLDFGLGSVSVLVEGTSQDTAEKDYSKPQPAPGQLLTHYAPDIPAFLVKRGDTSIQIGEQWHPLRVSRAVIVDFGGQFLQHAGDAIAYKNLTGLSGGAAVAATALFAALRWAENIPGAEGVLLADPRSIDSSEAAEAVRDRLFRAASGKVVIWESLLI